MTAISLDRIVSIGMFEHVGAAHFDEFFLTCRNLMTDDGVMLVHTIGKYGKASTPDPFTSRALPASARRPAATKSARSSGFWKITTRHAAVARRHSTRDTCPTRRRRTPPPPPVKA